MQLPLFFFFMFFPGLIWNTGEFGGKKIFYRRMQHTVLEIHFQSLKYTAVSRIRKNLSNFPLLSKRYKAITVCWCKQPTSDNFQRCLHCIYVLKFYDKSVIILVTNDLTSICKSAKFDWFYEWFILAMWVGGGKIEKLGRNECLLHR